MFGLLSDTVRLGWGALYWNTRKTAYRLGGRRGRCPCQAASDSGRGGETGCDAALGLRRPGRFRAVCPLLARRGDGHWICTVDAPDVRPFWGRALALGGGAALAVFLLGTVVGYGLLRGIGYDLSYRQVAWPPAWREFRGVQAEFYKKRAREARAEGRVADALLHLSAAYELNPRDYTAGLLLAQLRQITQPPLSDQIYARLLAEHPEQRDATAQAWLRALLARGDFAGVQRVAGERLLHSGPAPSPAWTQAFFFATRQLGDPAGLDQLLAAPAPGAPAHVVALTRLERALYESPAVPRVSRLAEAARSAAAPAPGVKPEPGGGADDDTIRGFHLAHLLRRLLEEGRADLVLPLADAPAAPLGPRERLRLQLDALASLGRDSERASLVRELLATPVHPAVCELLSSHLIAHPEPALLAAFADKLSREPLPRAAETTYPQLLAFYVACGVHGDAARLRLAAGWIAAVAGREFRALEAVEPVLLRLPAGARLENVLPVLQPMPLETTYALYARLAPPPPLAP